MLSEADTTDGVAFERTAVGSFFLDEQFVGRSVALFAMESQFMIGGLVPRPWHRDGRPVKHEGGAHPAQVGLLDGRIESHQGRRSPSYKVDELFP